MVANFFGDGEGLIDAGADGGAAQIVAGQPKAREAGAKLGDCGHAVGMTEIVLRKGAWPNRDVGKDRSAFDGEQESDFTVDEAGEFFRLQLCSGGISCSPDEAG